jgi:hypothetical protein
MTAGCNTQNSHSVGPPDKSQWLSTQWHYQQFGWEYSKNGNTKTQIILFSLLNVKKILKKWLLKKLVLRVFELEAHY